MELNCTGNGRSKRQRKEEPAHAGTRAGLQKVQTKTGARGTAEVGRRSVSSQRLTRAQQAEALQSQGTVVLTEVGGRPDMEWEAEHMEEVARPLFGSDDEGLQLAYATTALTLMNLAESHRIDIHKVIQFRCVEASGATVGVVMALIWLVSRRSHPQTSRFLCEHLNPPWCVQRRAASALRLLRSAIFGPGDDQGDGEVHCQARGGEPGAETGAVRGQLPACALPQPVAAL